MLSEQQQVRLIKVYNIPILINISLLRTFDTITKDDSKLSLNKHSCTIFFIVLISKSTRMEPKHVWGITYDLWEYTDPLILTMMKWILRSIHKNWFSFWMLMKIEEANNSLLSKILTVMNKSSNSHNLRNESLINFFDFFLVVILIILSALIFVFEITNEHSVHISSKKRCPIISKDHPIRINHRYYLENKFLTESLCKRVLWKQCFKKTMNNPAWMCFSRMDSSLDQYNLFLIKAHRGVLEISNR